VSNVHQAVAGVWMVESETERLWRGSK